MELRKMHPQYRKALRALQTGGSLPPAIKIQGNKANPQYQAIGRALKQIMPDRRVIEPFGGAAGLSLGMRPQEALLMDINPDLASFHQRLINDPDSLSFEPETFTYEAGDSVMMPNPNTGEMMDLGTVPQSLVDEMGGDPFFMGPKFYELRQEFNELRRKEGEGVISQRERQRKDQLFLVLQHMSMNGLLRYSPKTPNLFNRWAGSLRFTGNKPIEPSFESAYFDLMQGQKDRLKPGTGNTFRPQKLLGGKGRWELDPWSEAMQGWEYRDRPLHEQLESDIELNPAKDAFILDPPYMGEEGALDFFTMDDQERTLALIEGLASHGFPTVVFNSFAPEIVDPISDMGFDIHELQRKETSGGKGAVRGKKSELMGMANIDQDAFQNAWEKMRQGN